MVDSAVKLDVGFPAPDFRLPASSGDEVGLKDFSGKANLVLFFVREYG